MNARRLAFSLVLALLAATRADEPRGLPQTPLHLDNVELKDQFNETRRLSFPRTNLLVLTVADQQGAKQVAAWVRPLKERFPEGLPIEGVADVSRVPALLRPLVRREFKQQFEHPILLDWSGRVVRQLDCAPEVVNVFAVATNGAVLWTGRGPAETNQLAELMRLLETHHNRQPSPPLEIESRRRDRGPARSAAATPETSSR